MPVPLVCHSARRVAPTTISALGRPDGTACESALVVSMPGVGPDHSHALNDCAVVTSVGVGICSFPANSAPRASRRGDSNPGPHHYEVLLPSPQGAWLSQICRDWAACATRVPTCGRVAALGDAASVRWRPSRARAPRSLRVEPLEMWQLCQRLHSISDLAVGSDPSV